MPMCPHEEILVTLAERPHPFPSRTRQLSSPAPKILRGQPFGKIGRRQGLFRFPGHERGPDEPAVIEPTAGRVPADRRRPTLSAMPGILTA